MKEIMAETLPELEPQPSDFLSTTLETQSEAMARYSVGATPVPDWREVEDIDELARVLTEVKVDDPHFAEIPSNLFQASSQEVFDAASLAMAKAVALRTEAPSKGKTIIDRFVDKVGKDVGEFLASKGGKRALIGMTGLSLVATACSKEATPTITPEVSTPQAVATETAPPPTETATAEPTATPTETPTVEPSPTPEPIRALDEEVQQEVIQEFMARPENQKYASFEEAVEDFENNSGYRPTIGSGWNGDEFGVARQYMVVGHRDISAAGLPGFREGEMLKTMFLVHPSNPDKLVPVIIAIKTGNNWQLLTDFTDGLMGGGNSDYRAITQDPGRYETYFYKPKEIVVIGQDQSLDEWLDSVIGQVNIAGVMYYLGNNDPSSADLPYYYDVVRRLIAIPGGYVEKFTNDPDEYLGQANEVGHRTVDPVSVVDLLDPQIDVGGFIASQIGIGLWK